MKRKIVMIRAARQLIIPVLIVVIFCCGTAISQAQEPQSSDPEALTNPELAVPEVSESDLAPLSLDGIGLSTAAGGLPNVIWLRQDRQELINLLQKINLRKLHRSLRPLVVALLTSEGYGEFPSSDNKIIYARLLALLNSGEIVAVREMLQLIPLAQYDEYLWQIYYNSELSDGEIEFACSQLNALQEQVQSLNSMKLVVGCLSYLGLREQALEYFKEIYPVIIASTESVLSLVDEERLKAQRILLAWERQDYSAIWRENNLTPVDILLTLNEDSIDQELDKVWQQQPPPELTGAISRMLYKLWVEPQLVANNDAAITTAIPQQLLDLLLNDGWISFSEYLQFINNEQWRTEIVASRHNRDVAVRVNAYWLDQRLYQSKLAWLEYLLDNDFNQLDPVWSEALLLTPPNEIPALLTALDSNQQLLEKRKRQRLVLLLQQILDYSITAPVAGTTDNRALELASRGQLSKSVMFNQFLPSEAAAELNNKLQPAHRRWLQRYYQHLDRRDTVNLVVLFSQIGNAATLRRTHSLFIAVIVQGLLEFDYASYVAPLIRQALIWRGLT